MKKNLTATRFFLHLAFHCKDSYLSERIINHGLIIAGSFLHDLIDEDAGISDTSLTSRSS